MNIFGLGPTELLLILFVLLLFFGKNRLPDLARSIGKSFRELKEGLKEGAKGESDSSNKKNSDK